MINANDGPSSYDFSGKSPYFNDYVSAGTQFILGAGQSVGSDNPFILGAGQPAGCEKDASPARNRIDEAVQLLHAEQKNFAEVNMALRAQRAEAEKSRDYWKGHYADERNARLAAEAGCNQAEAGLGIWHARFDEECRDRLVAEERANFRDLDNDVLRKKLNDVLNERDHALQELQTLENRTVRVTFTHPNRVTTFTTSPGWSELEFPLEDGHLTISRIDG